MKNAPAVFVLGMMMSLSSFAGRGDVSTLHKGVDPRIMYASDRGTDLLVIRGQVAFTSVDFKFDAALADAQILEAKRQGQVIDIVMTEGSGKLLDHDYKHQLKLQVRPASEEEKQNRFLQMSDKIIELEAENAQLRQGR